MAPPSRLFSLVFLALGGFGYGGLFLFTVCPFCIHPQDSYMSVELFNLILGQAAFPEGVVFSQYSQGLYGAMMNPGCGLCFHLPKALPYGTVKGFFESLQGVAV